MNTRRINGACLLAIVAIAILLAGSALNGSASAALLTTCPDDGYSQPFTRWLDLAGYTLAPNGAFESGSTGWKLDGSSAVGAGNESFYVHGVGDGNSLSLPSGSSATSSSMCVAATDPTLRFFVRNSGSLLSTLKVEALYTNVLGQPQATTVALLSGGSTWQPTLPLPFLANLTSPPLVSDGTTAVAFRFTPQGSPSGWRIDDVYVDPFKSD